MKRYPSIIFIWVTGLLYACTAHEEGEEPVSNKQEMKFNFFLTEGEEVIPLNTRAADYDADNGFQLYGIYSQTDLPGTVNTAASTSLWTSRFFDDEQVQKDGTYGGSKRYWAGDGVTRHSFFAYAGTTNNTTGAYIMDPAYKLGDTGYNYPVLRYQQAEEPALQQDFLVAYGPTNLIIHQSVPVVNIYFHHACARIVFKIMSTGGSSVYNCSAQIAYTSNAVRKQGEVYYKPQLKAAATTYFAISPQALRKSGDAITVPASANSDGKAVFMGDLKLVPQLLPDAWAKVTISYTKTTAGGAAITASTMVPGIKIDPDKQYTFYLTIGEQSEKIKISDVTIEPWKTEKHRVDPLK